MLFTLANVRFSFTLTPHLAAPHRRIGSNERWLATNNDNIYIAHECTPYMDNDYKTRPIFSLFLILQCVITSVISRHWFFFSFSSPAADAVTAPAYCAVVWLMVWWFFFRCVLPSLALDCWSKLFICLSAFSQILHNLMTISIVWPVLLCHNPLLPYLMLSYLIILLWIERKNVFGKRINFFHISSFDVAIVSLRNFMIRHFAVVLHVTLSMIYSCIHSCNLSWFVVFFFSSIWFCSTVYTHEYMFVFGNFDFGFESFHWMAFNECQ